MNIKDLKRIIKSDLRNHGYNGFKSLFQIYFFNSSFRLLLNYRVGNFLILRKKPNSSLIKYFRYRMITKRGCYISYTAEIGENIRFPHPIGIVVGEGVKLGNNIKIWQHVTLGSSGRTGQNQSYPKIGDHVRIYEKASLLGDIKVGKNTIIGAYSLVLNDVPDNNITRGIPAKNYPR